MPRVWLVTGCTTGFGKFLVEEIIQNGEIVVATARKPETLKFENTSPKNYLALKLDVTSNSDIDAAFNKAVETFGRIDVVVNNAGYGLIGPFEEVSEEQVRKQMEVNFFGLIQVTRRALDVMRNQKPSGGLIQQITSIGGQLGVPQFSIYCASKWAVEAFTESVSNEIKKDWNIKLQCVEPGGFRTDWSGRSMAEPEKRLPAYDHLNASQTKTNRHMTQDGDPKKGAKAMYQLASLPDPPLRAVIGSDAQKLIHTKIKQYGDLYSREDLTKIANSTDVDE